MIQQITQRLSEINMILSTCKQDNFSFGQALSLALFYRDYSDTNTLVSEATGLAKENPDGLSELSSSLVSETDKYLSLDKSGLQEVDFKAIFEGHLKPFETRYKESMEKATELWRKYSAMSNRLDFLPLDSDEFKSLDKECDAKKAEYDIASAHNQQVYE